MGRMASEVSLPLPRFERITGAERTWVATLVETFYAGGVSLAAIAHRIGRTEMFVETLLRERGVRLRPDATAGYHSRRKR